jgi:hypothetical protein
VASGARAPLFVLLVVRAPAAALALATAVALALAPRGARADAPAAHARLVYFVDPTATGCPSADEFRAAVSARAGHELFGEPSDVPIDVTLRRTDATYVATVGLPEAPGTAAATRELRSETGCAELATAAALVVSIALDPESVLRAPPAAPPPAPPTPPTAPASRSWRAFIGAGPRGAWGLTPEPTAGLALSASAMSERLSFGVELGGFLDNEARYARGSVSVLPLTLTFLPCGMAAHVELCAVARLGLLRGTGAGFTEDDSTWKAFGAAGLRGAAFVDVGRLRFRASVEGTGVAPTTIFYVRDFVGETAVYATRGVSLAAGLDVLLLFP